MAKHHSFLDLYDFLRRLRDAARQRRHRAVKVTVHLSVDEKATLAAAADQAGMALPTYLSQACLEAVGASAAIGRDGI